MLNQHLHNLTIFINHKQLQNAGTELVMTESYCITKISY